MRRCSFVLSFALAASAVMAQDGGDPLKAPDCRRALEALQAQEAKLTGQAQGQTEQSRREALARLEPLRQRAARACLQARTDPAPSGRLAQPPVSVPPVTVAPPRPLPPPPAVSLPRRADPPPVVTACDAAGCWASDGTRLPRAGPNLLGPRGLCTVTGTLLHCP